jgi:DNA-binding CsgD family transcriptional regulator
MLPYLTRAVYAGSREMTTAQPAPQPAGQGEPLTPRRLKLPCLKLSDRELEVVFLVARDYTDAQIADELSLHIQSVRNYIYFAKNKLSVRGRVGLAAWYYRSFGFPQ